MLGFEIGMGLVAIISLLGLFDSSLVGEARKQFASICIAAIVCWSVIMYMTTL